MNASTDPSAATQPPASGSSGEPSLVPACGFLLLILCVIFSVAMVFLAWWLYGGDQSKHAARALQKQLIPWVEQSSLSEPDRRSVVEQLEALVADMNAGLLSDEQLRRLIHPLNSAPILQWGCIEELQRQSRRHPELTAAEKEAIDQACDRLMRSALEGKMAMEQLSYIVQKVATTERLSQKLNPIENNRSDDLREFWRRAESVCDKLQVSREPLDKSPAQVFRLMVDKALHPAPVP
jgi:hypothetical protein